MRLLALFLASMLLSGCIGYDFKDVDKDPSYMLPLTDTSDSQVGRTFEELLEQNPGKSAFYIQNDGIDALATRILMSGRAKYSIDAQYYLFSRDETTLAYVGALLAAADRGVRVRLLLDDILTSGYDRGMIALDSHPNMEIRLYNPFLRRNARWMDGMLGFKRVNRRMHNKSFTVDNRFTIIGGRNIGAEYFAARDDMNFADMDIAGFGPVVQDVSNMFDRYWNDDLAVPASEVIAPPAAEDVEAEIQRMRDQVAQAMVTMEESKYAAALSANIQDLFSITSDDFFWADYEVVYDDPEKGRTDQLGKDAKRLGTRLQASVEQAEKSLLIVSPYFVPDRQMMQRVEALRERDIRIIVITNSLASTNHNVVHSGYAPSRKKLLKLGVEIWETKPDRYIRGTDKSGKNEASSGLHTKGFIVDKEEFFLGSFNLDPRSKNINTELGVIVKSPAMSAELFDEGLPSLPEQAYQVILTKQGDLAWVDTSGDKPVVYTKEPETSWGQRTKVGFMRILPVNGQL